MLQLQPQRKVFSRGSVKTAECRADLRYTPILRSLLVFRRLKELFRYSSDDRIFLLLFFFLKHLSFPQNSNTKAHPSLAKSSLG